MVCRWPGQRLVRFCGEESAGASFLKRDGSVWTTDKDGIILGLIAAEIMAKTGRDPSQFVAELTAELGVPFYGRIDVPATAQQKNALKAVSPERLNIRELAGDLVRVTRATAPGNGQPIGGIKVETDTGWFAARPSSTEDVCKIYAEKFSRRRPFEKDSERSAACHSAHSLIRRNGGLLSAFNAKRMSTAGPVASRSADIYTGPIPTKGRSIAASMQVGRHI